MSLFEVDKVPAARPERLRIEQSSLDLALSAQLIVAWAGEKGETPRLGWWRSDLVSEFGGEDLFKQLMPATWRWAVLQAAREAARRRDTELRGEGHDADKIVSLFSLGFELDERIDERLRDLKSSGVAPTEALPQLEIISEEWNRDRFLEWILGHGEAKAAGTPLGRQLKGAPPPAFDELIQKLVAGLAPLVDNYPLPHFQRDE